MGFTTFPSSLSQAGLDFSFAKIATDADLITFHIEGGVPWADAASDNLAQPIATHYNANILSDWTYQRSKIPAGHKVFVAVNSLNMDRNGIALSWTIAGTNQSVSPWNSNALNAPAVKAAYLKYCLRAIQFFNPDYFAFGIEVNLLSTNSPTQWTAYMELHQHVYSQLKVAHPTLPIFVTQTAVNLLAGYDAHTTPETAFNQLIAQSDRYAISVYPYLSSFMTTTLPSNLFDRLVALAPQKQIVISESGYPAKSFSISGPLTFDSSEEKQDQFVRLLLAAGDTHSFEFINLYLVRDFDDSIGSSDALTLFKYIGLFDESGSPRSARVRWVRRLAAPLKP